MAQSKITIVIGTNGIKGVHIGGMYSTLSDIDTTHKLYSTIHTEIKDFCQRVDEKLAAPPPPTPPEPKYNVGDRIVGKSLVNNFAIDGEIRNTVWDGIQLEWFYDVETEEETWERLPQDHIISATTPSNTSI